MHQFLVGHGSSNVMGQHPQRCPGRFGAVVFGQLLGDVPDPVNVGLEADRK
jgi:hypothetical protein